MSSRCPRVRPCLSGTTTASVLPTDVNSQRFDQHKFLDILKLKLYILRFQLKFKLYVL